LKRNGRQDEYLKVAAAVLDVHRRGSIFDLTEVVEGISYVELKKNPRPELSFGKVTRTNARAGVE
jgi:hypothetical protein